MRSSLPWWVAISRHLQLPPATHGGVTLEVDRVEGPGLSAPLSLSVLRVKLSAYLALLALADRNC